MASMAAIQNPMDGSIWAALRDKTPEKRITGARNLEKAIETHARDDPAVIEAVIKRLENEYLPTSYNLYVRCGGLVGLAAIAIATAPHPGRFLKKMVPLVVTSFSDQDATIRFYACESVYNIAKVAKGEILVYFNVIFDDLSKLVADSEPSVRNAADLLDRLIRDIVCESAATYVTRVSDPSAGGPDGSIPQMAFSLPRFIPLLQERLEVLKHNTRNFLINWIKLLNSIPGLDMVSYLPSFLAGLFKYLSDTNIEVQQNATDALLLFLREITEIAQVQNQAAEDQNGSAAAFEGDVEADDNADNEAAVSDRASSQSSGTGQSRMVGEQGSMSDCVSQAGYFNYAAHDDEYLDRNDWIPGQNMDIDYVQVLEILGKFIGPDVDDHIVQMALHWIDALFEISPRAIVMFFPRLLRLVLPALGHPSEHVQKRAGEINVKLTKFVNRLEEPAEEPDPPDGTTIKYDNAVIALEDQLLHENESTRVSALEWLITLHHKSPNKTLTIHDGTFPALLKTLSDPSEAVVTRDLLLLSQISHTSDEWQFKSFMAHLLQLFSTDRKLLEVRGNLIIRQLCTTLRPDRIYRALADCLDKDDDVDFASIMVQNLNNNLITAPELQPLRSRLRALDTRDGQTLFVTLSKPWCHNPVSIFSLYLLAQAYEQAYQLLTVFGEIRMTVELLLQIDKLVQLIESPVFTYLRLQLLEPERHPFLHKCLYGLLMLLPQSGAFYALQNRLQTVSGIGLLHLGPAGPKAGSARSTGSQLQPMSTAGYDRPGRLKAREESAIQWADLLDRFRSVQDATRRKAAASAAAAAATIIDGLSLGPGGAMTAATAPPPTSGSNARSSHIRLAASSPHRSAVADKRAGPTAGTPALGPAPTMTALSTPTPIAGATLNAAGTGAVNSGPTTASMIPAPTGGTAAGLSGRMAVGEGAGLSGSFGGGVAATATTGTAAAAAAAAIAGPSVSTGGSPMASPSVDGLGTGAATPGSAQVMGPKTGAAKSVSGDVGSTAKPRPNKGKQTVGPTDRNDGRPRLRMA